MIEFFSETEFTIELQDAIASWIEQTVIAEGCELGDISFVFCNDSYLHKINVEFLDHDTFTDIITFDYSIGKLLNGEIYISVERVKENAEIFEVSFVEELHRVMIHGILHLCGYKDKQGDEEALMRSKENKYLSFISHLFA